MAVLLCQVIDVSPGRGDTDSIDATGTGYLTLATIAPCG
jgi:hypothetical protein